jgi:hypothetical protein
MSRFASAIAAAIASTLALSLPAVLAACGTVTGLSDEYTFSDDASADGGGAADAASTDAASVDSAVLDATSTSCNANQAAALATELTSTDGAPPCKLCLQQQCCQPTLACLSGAAGSECKNRLECELKCTNKTSLPDRLQCVQQCEANHDMTPAFGRIVACQCTSCGFQ